jgi:hypothetical protein
MPPGGDGDPRQAMTSIIPAIFPGIGAAERGWPVRGEGRQASKESPGMAGSGAGRGEVAEFVDTVTFLQHPGAVS